MARNRSALFLDHNFLDLKRKKQDKMKDEISSLTSEELDENSTDSLAIIFSSKYTPSQIELHDVIKKDGGQVEKEVRNRAGIPNIGRGTPTRKYERLKVKFQFDGDKKLFRYKPSSFNFSPPLYDKLRSSEVVRYFDFRTQNREAEEVKEELRSDIEGWKDDVRWWVENLNSDIRQMREKSENKARSAIERRRDEVETKTKVMEDLGVDTGGSESQGFIVPEKKRSIELPKPDDSSSLNLLPDNHYLEVLGIIDDLGVNIERSAERLRDLDEESLRDIFLAGINSHYAGIAQGESFNRGGKTDILLPYENRNLFVAECKFWSGQAQFIDAIDQLIGNLTVRDSHACLMMFSRREGFNEIRAKAEKATKSHEQFETELPGYDNHDVYRFNINSGTPVKIAVKVFDLN
ncbi:MULTISPECIES: hypothetical protein [Halobacterium]|uniref:hypothetical protein n=1 Tax=Halobacterium TaxID=2239 RepID=UPI00073E6EE3|nr:MULTISPECIES: hypothetical protein [Halobacterium]MCG1001876.1 hypothetical protein [Halobacterium noricense]